ncbi:uncharacterized protein ABDE67_020485 [Symphorus nematophorus]
MHQRIFNKQRVPPSSSETYKARLLCAVPLLSDINTDTRTGQHFPLVSQFGRRLKTQTTREKMICRILLLIKLSSCVCGTFVVNVTQTSYQAEENHNITLEWTFTTKTDASLNSLQILCEMVNPPKNSGLFHLHEGVEVSESQDEQFAGRVQCDKDVLREGRIRLHVSRLRTEDSGLYVCEVKTNYGANSGVCHLNVTAAADEPKPPRPTVSPKPENWGMIVAYVALAAAGLVVIYKAYKSFYYLCHKNNRLARDSRLPTSGL